MNHDLLWDALDKVQYGSLTIIMPDHTQRTFKGEHLGYKSTLIIKDLDCIDVNNGKILYTTTEVKKGINKKYLSDILNKYFNDNHRAEEICQFILENRESQVKENIKLKKDKI